MARTSIALTLVALIASLLVGCDKAPSGVIPESDMVHVLADFAKAEAIIEQHPGKFDTDSSKLALKQSILEKYDANLEMYDSSLVWYAHNLKLYSQLHEKAIVLLEKEGGIKHDENGNGTAPWANGRIVQDIQATGAKRRVFASSGDSANVWAGPQQWVLTSAMRRGYIPYDFKPDKESRQGDHYSLNLKAINGSGNNVKVLLAVDYTDGTTGYINRTLNINGWSNFDLQTDSSRTVKRIYGFLQYSIKPQRVTVIDSIYLLRTHLDPTKYSMFNIQRKAGPKAAFAKDSVKNASAAPPMPVTESTMPGMPASVQRRRLPGQPIGIKRPGSADSMYRPKPGLNKAVIRSRQNVPNPNGNHTPKPPIK